MMKLPLSLLMLWITFGLNAQNQSIINKILTKKKRQVDIIQPEKSKTTTLISSEFAEESVVAQAMNYDDLTILKVYYVSTKYRLSQEFSQKELDQKRLFALQNKIPGILDDPYIEWELIEQTGCRNAQEGKDYFHGFVLIHRPIMSKEERAKEINQLAEILKNPKSKFVDHTPIDPFEKELEHKGEEIPSSLSDTDAMFKDGEFALFEYFKKNLDIANKITQNRDDVWVKTKVKIDEKGKVQKISFRDDYKDYVKVEVKKVLEKMPDWSPAVEGGKKVKSEVNLEIRTSYSRIVNGMYTRDEKMPQFSEAELTPIVGEDKELTEAEQQKVDYIEKSSVFRGLQLLEPNEKVAIVMDVTGSMLKNLAELNWWMLQNPDTLRIVSYTFFNDGDGLEDRKKKIGQTGGFHQTELEGRVPATIMGAMHAGNGGDGPENDLEAVMYAENNNPQAAAIVLLADNSSDIRDISLLSQLTKKVHVLICAKPKIIRKDYLNVVKQTGGMLIVDGKKISLDDVQVNDQFVIGESSYTYDTTGFHLR